jgi:hypothetical protein
MSRVRFISSLIMLMSIISMGTAEANCIMQGKVSRVRTGTPGNFVDIQAIGNLPAFATFFGVVIDRHYEMLSAAQAGGFTVFVTGDAISCPTTGAFRNGGNVIGVDILRNQ